MLVNKERIRQEQYLLIGDFKTLYVMFSCSCCVVRKIREWMEGIVVIRGCWKNGVKLCYNTSKLLLHFFLTIKKGW